MKGFIKEGATIKSRAAGIHIIQIWPKMCRAVWVWSSRIYFWATLPFEYGSCRSDQLEPFQVPGVWLTCPLIQDIYADDERILKKERKKPENRFPAEIYGLV